MRQHTLASALQEALLLSLNTRCRVLAQEAVDEDAPDYERVVRQVDVMLQQLTAEERLAQAEGYDQRTTHIAFAVDEDCKLLRLGYQLEVTATLGERGRWQSCDEEQGARYEIIGKEMVPPIAGVRNHTRLALSQVTVVR